MDCGRFTAVLKYHQHISEDLTWSSTIMHNPCEVIQEERSLFSTDVYSNVYTEGIQSKCKFHVDCDDALTLSPASPLSSVSLPSALRTDSPPPSRLSEAAVRSLPPLPLQVSLTLNLEFGRPEL